MVLVVLVYIGTIRCRVEEIFATDSVRKVSSSARGVLKVSSEKKAQSLGGGETNLFASGSSNMIAVGKCGMVSYSVRGCAE